jgi:hypothetical protein
MPHLQACELAALDPVHLLGRRRRLLRGEAHARQDVDLSWGVGTRHY